MPGTVEMQPDLVIRQAAFGEISPALAVNQHAGFEIGEGAALGPDPGSGGDSHLRTGARKIQIAQEGNGAGAVAQLNALGKNRTPFQNMTDAEEAAMKAELEAINFFERCNKF